MPGPIRFVEIAYRKSDLLRMEPLHRRYFLMLGQLYNDIATLTVILVQHYPSAFEGEEPKPIRARRTMGALLAIRQLAARLWEVHKLIDGQFGLFVRELSKDAPSVKEHLKRVRAYLSSPNAMKVVRHSAASHFDPETIDRGIAAIPEEAVVSDYLSDSAGNCTFDAADTILLYGLSVELQAVWNDGVARDPLEVMSKLTSEIRDAAMMVMDMSVALQQTIYNRYLPTKADGVQRNISVVRSQPLLEEITAAVFIVGPADQQSEREAGNRSRAFKRGLYSTVS